MRGQKRVGVFHDPSRLSCDLLDDFERIGDASSPEGIPEGVDLVANRAGNHGRLAIAGSLITGRWVGKKGVAFGESSRGRREYRFRRRLHPRRSTRSSSVVGVSLLARGRTPWRQSTHASRECDRVVASPANCHEIGYMSVIAMGGISVTFDFPFFANGVLPIDRARPGRSISRKLWLRQGVLTLLDCFQVMARSSF